eukprot:snap_masked-scaffold_8-processed-gene-5.25-mRNA-1 protein AED:1.00 eAED:1.00 QI:0/0/0/0/1/1/2/0/151
MSCEKPFVFDEETQNCSSTLFEKHETYAICIVVAGVAVRTAMLITWFFLLSNYLYLKRKILFSRRHANASNLFFVKQNVKAMLSVGVVLTTGLYIASEGYLLKIDIASRSGKILAINCTICWSAVALRFIHFSPVMSRLLGIEGEDTLTFL